MRLDPTRVLTCAVSRPSGDDRALPHVENEDDGLKAFAELSSPEHLMEVDVVDFFESYVEPLTEETNRQRQITNRQRQI